MFTARRGPDAHVGASLQYVYLGCCVYENKGNIQENLTFPAQVVASSLPSPASKQSREAHESTVLGSLGSAHTRHSATQPEALLFHIW